MPVFNRERFVGEAIQSVVDHDFADFELLIVDDGSTDRTPEIVRTWAQRDARIVVLTLPGNAGIPAALNAGLRQARGVYVARLDSDDVMLPQRLAAQAAVLDNEPDTVLVSCGYETMDGAGTYLGTRHRDEPHEVIAYLLNFHNPVPGGTVMFRRPEVLADGGFAPECPVSSDYDLAARLLRRGRIRTLRLTGIRVREHDDRTSIRCASIKRPIWTPIMRRSLARYLGRPIGDEEIAALITVWRLDGTIGMAGTAQKTMREAFARFSDEHEDPAWRRLIRERTARQWLEGARAFRSSGHLAEAMRYWARAARWSPATVLDAALRQSRMSKLLRARERMFDWLKDIVRPVWMDDPQLGRLRYFRDTRTWEGWIAFPPVGRQIEILLTGTHTGPTEHQREFLRALESRYEQLWEAVRPDLLEAAVSRPKVFTLVGIDLPAVVDDGVEWELCYETEPESWLFTVQMRGWTPENVSVEC
jgi:GT2 family glycosyltransferase